MKRFLFAVLAIAVIGLTGCGKDDGEGNLIELTSTNQTMHYDDEFQIQATSSTPITYTSENEYHAEVSASGLVTAGRIGETNIVMTNGEDTKKIKITVNPESNLYPESDLTFGMSRSAVKAKLGEPDSETADGIGYTAYSNNAPIFMCIFDGTDKLTSFSYMVKTSYSSELGTFLAERYVPVSIGGEDFSILCANKLNLQDATMIVGAKLYDISYWMVLYMKYEYSDTRALTDCSDAMKSINELMNKMN